MSKVHGIVHVRNKHLVTMRIPSDPLCPACGEEEETVHFLVKCCATVTICYHNMRAYILQHEELCEVDTVQFAKASLGC